MTPVEIARTQLGVRWAHQGRSKGKAIDCVGLLVVAFAGYGLKDRTDYGRDPYAGQLERMVADQFGPPVPGPPQVGDVVLMVFPDKTANKAVRHVGIIGDYQGAGGGLSLIHTWNGGPGVVIETRVDNAWIRRFRFIHRLGELA